MRRAHRIAAITKTLVERPNHVFAVGDFVELFDVARSTLSEDLAIIRATFNALNMGKIETIAGAVGGVRYVPHLTKDQVRTSIEEVCARLREPERILPGGLLYIDDLISSPSLLSIVGSIFATAFGDRDPEYVVTVETAGTQLPCRWPMPWMSPCCSAQASGPQKVGADHELPSGSRQVETMSLSRRALPEGGRVLLIDDFMKAGGTLRGLSDLMGEFACTVVGKGVLIETGWPEEKLIDDHLPLVYLREVDVKEQKVTVEPADWILS